MNTKIILMTGICFALMAGVVCQSNTSTVVAQVIRDSCGCGQPKCSGCLKGKLFPVAKKVKQKVEHKRGCGCNACSQNVGVGQQQVVSDVLISQEYLPEITSSACGCKKPSCTGCKQRRVLRTPSPQCDCDFCELKVSKTKEKKKCFEVKQKEICVPPVRLPWKKCCPPTKAKVRVVNVLSTKSYDSPSCKYEWKVFEPETSKSADSSGAVKVNMSDSTTASSVDAAAPVSSSAPKMMPALPNPDKVDLNSVPRPPVEKN